MLSSILANFASVSFTCCWGCSVTKSCPTLCDPMNCSTPGFSVLHYVTVFAQTHVHWVTDAIHLFLCHPLLLLPSIFPSIKVFSNEWALALHIRWTKYFSFGSNEYSGVISFRIDWFDLLHWYNSVEIPVVRDVSYSWEV